MLEVGTVDVRMLGAPPESALQALPVGVRPASGTQPLPPTWKHVEACAAVHTVYASCRLPCRDGAHPCRGGGTQVVESMRGGSVRLAVVPPALGYGAVYSSLAQGRVPPNSSLYYEVELLRCQQFTIGLACCSDAAYPCIKQPAAAGLGAPGTPTAAAAPPQPLAP